MQPRNDARVATSTQLRAFADRLILCSVRDDHISISEGMTRQSVRQRVIYDSRQGITPHVQHFTKLDENIAVVDIQRVTF